MTTNDWYNNKDLFEMFQSLNNEMISLREEMIQTRTIIRDYNGLRKTIDEVKDRVGVIEQIVKDNEKTENKQTGMKRDYVAWGFAFLMFLIALLQYFKG